MSLTRTVAKALAEHLDDGIQRVKIAQTQDGRYAVEAMPLNTEGPLYFMFDASMSGEDRLVEMDSNIWQKGERA